MLKEKIYQYFSEKEKKQFDDTKEINFAPSYFKDCKKKIFYKKTGESESNPISEAGFVKMEMGKSIHDKIQNILKNMKILSEAEDYKGKEYQGLKIIYRLDGIIEIDKKKIIIEIKTVYASGFNSIENEPRENDLIQLILYMELEEIDDGILLYIGRDNGFMVEYNIRRGNKIYGKICKKILDKIAELKKLKEQIENKELPDRDFKIQLKNKDGEISEKFQKDKVSYKSDWQCSYCQWKNLCWKDYYEEIKNHSFCIDGKFS